MAQVNTVRGPVEGAVADVTTMLVDDPRRILEGGAFV